MVSDFLSGMVAMGFLAAGVFFLRFWRRTGDTLFAAFGIAFLLLALQQILLVGLGFPREEQSWTFLLRLAAFGLLIMAIVRKNLEGRKKAD